MSEAVMPEADTGAEASAWAALHAELSAWATAGRQATFWWRDDDAHRDCSELSRLLYLASDTDVPVALAVVPSWLEPSLAAALESNTHATVFQHGWQHVNHAKGSGDKGAWELGLHRGREAVVADLERGRDVLVEAFGDRFLPVVTPPWNKIDSALLPELPALGFHGVTIYGARVIGKPVSRLMLNNCHCDPVDWKKGPSFRGTARTLSQLTEHLSARRTAKVDAAEATGLLTHHLDMDEDTWQFTEQLLRFLSAHPAIRVLSPGEVFAS